jgi:hypothetical protein
MKTDRQRQRSLVGKAMLAVSMAMLLLAGLYFFRVIPLPDQLWPLVPMVLFAAGLVDGMVGLRFLNE